MRTRDDETAPSSITDTGPSNHIIDKPGRRLAWIVLGLIAVFASVVLLFPMILRGLTVSRLSDLTPHQIELANVSLNLLTGHVEIDGLLIRSNEDRSDLMRFPTITADIDMVSLFKRDVVLRRLEVLAPIVHVLRTEKGIWSLPGGARRASAHSTPDISLTVQSAHIQDGTLTIENRSLIPVRQERLTHIQLTLTNLSSRAPDPAKIHGSARIAESGSIVIDGTALSNFGSGTMKVDLAQVPLATIEGYLGDEPVMQGLVDAHLSLTWPGKGTSPVWIAGMLEGHDITFSSADRPKGHAAAISLSQVDVMWPDTVTMNQVVVTKPDIWIHRNENGHFVGGDESRDISRKTRPSSNSIGPRSEPATPIRWFISKIIVRGGTVHLEDRTVTPSYSDVLQHLELSLDEVGSAPNHPVRIIARADIGSGGALDLYGRASLLDPMPSASLKAAIHQFVIPSTNPYLEQTISHHTTEGTLTSVMDIQLGGGELKVISHMTLSDLQVEPVRNPTRRTVQEQIGLPLGLLIALLKDDTGRIAITFPLSGPLSNPTFDWTNAIWATIRNSVVKLITFPIRSIGRLLMGTHQTDPLPLEPITFDPGSSTIRPAMERKLRELAKLLDSADGTVLHLTPILSATDLDALQHLPLESWPVPALDTPETAGYVLAVRRAYLVAARVAGLKGVSASRLPVAPPRHGLSEAVMPRVELQLGNAADISKGAAPSREQD